MSDGTTLNAGTGGDIIRTIAKTSIGQKVQSVLLDIGGGTDGSPETILTAGRQLSANSVSVTFASDIPTLPVSFSGQSGTPTQADVTVGTSSGQLVPAGLFSKFLRVKVPLGAANGIYIRWDGGTASASGAASEYLAPGEAIVWQAATGYLPTCVINAIAIAGVDVTVIGA